MNAEQFLNKKVRVIKTVNNKPFYYRGLLSKIDEDSILIDDIKDGMVMIRIKDISEIMEIRI